MANKVHLTAFFMRKAKRLLNKDHTLDDSPEKLEDNLIKNPKMGDNYGCNIYKVRLADDSKGKGKVAASEL